MADTFDKCIETLAGENWNMVEGHPDLCGAHDCFDVLRAQSFAVNLEQTLADHPAVMKPEVVWNIQAGLALNSEKIRQAIRTQGRIINGAAKYMREIDLLICPAVSVISVPAELRYPDSDGNTAIPAIHEYYRWLAIAYATTLTALPIITLPCGLADCGMPFGIQLIGKPGGEYQLFQHARLLEQITNWSCKPVDPVQFIHSGDAKQ